MTTTPKQWGLTEEERRRAEAIWRDKYIGYSWSGRAMALDDQIRELVARVEKLEEALGGIVDSRWCANNPCIFHRGQGGMMTQGRCRHDGMDKYSLRKELREIANEIRAALEKSP